MGKRIMLAIFTVFMFALPVWAAQTIDYGDEASFEAALKQGENLEGKIVQFTAREFHPESALVNDPGKRIIGDDGLRNGAQEAFVRQSGEDYAVIGDKVRLFTGQILVAVPFPEDDRPFMAALPETVFQLPVV